MWDSWSLETMSSSERNFLSRLPRLRAHRRDSMAKSVDCSSLVSLVSRQPRLVVRWQQDLLELARAPPIAQVRKSAPCRARVSASRPLRRARGRAASGRCSRTTLALPRAPRGDEARRHATARAARFLAEVPSAEASAKEQIREWPTAASPWPVDIARDGEEGRQEGESPARSERR